MQQRQTRRKLCDLLGPARGLWQGAHGYVRRCRQSPRAGGAGGARCRLGGRVWGGGGHGHPGNGGRVGEAPGFHRLEWVGIGVGILGGAVVQTHASKKDVQILFGLAVSDTRCVVSMRRIPGKAYRSCLGGLSPCQQGLESIATEQVAALGERTAAILVCLSKNKAGIRTHRHPGRPVWRLDTSAAAEDEEKNELKHKAFFKEE